MPLGQVGFPDLPNLFGLQEEEEEGFGGREFGIEEPPDDRRREKDPGLGGVDPCMDQCTTISTGSQGMPRLSIDPTCLANCRGEDPGTGKEPPFGDLDLGIPGGEGGGEGGGGGGGIDFGNLGSLFQGFKGIGPFTDNPLLQQLQAFLSEQLQGPFGIDPDVLRRQRNIITGSGAQREQQALQNLAASLNTVGQLGGGRQIQLGREISEDTRRGVSGQLNELATLDALRAQADRDAIVGQILGFGGLLGQSGSQQISQQLGFGDLKLRELLGLGNLKLGQGDLDLRRILGLGGLEMQSTCMRLRMAGINIC